jgi:hypothetical protein
VFATHHVALADTEDAYDIFAAASETQALKVVMQAVPVGPGLIDRHNVAAAV